ncbi:MAG: MurT ligase domain-containing protein [Propionibacteriaceae bacterium]|nr:MurT ligase domain-containing protein [Propionibacteriaceae bacterium]
MSRIKDAAAFVVGKAMLAGMRLLGKSGYHLPGMYAYRLSPTVFNFIAKPKDVVFITGTNGKSTTTALVRHILQTAGHKVASNTESNTQPGIIAGLLRSTTIFNRSKADVMVLETSEEALPKVVATIRPQTVLLTNIQRDTYQVNLSPNYIYDKICGALGDDMTLWLNNEDPHILSLERRFPKTHVYSMAGNDYSQAPDSSPFAVTQPCPICQQPIVFDQLNLPSIGQFHCSACDLRSHGDADVRGSAFDLDKGTITIGQRTFPMHYRAPHFAYNYLLAYAYAKSRGISDDTIERAFDSFTNIDGRLETQQLDATRIHYSRFKQETPDTLQSAIDLICLDPGPKTVLVDLHLVDNMPWGPRFAESGYAYDANFEKLAGANVSRFICTGSVIGYDAANRLRYAGVDPELIEVLPTDDPADFVRALRSDQPNEAYILAYLGYYKKIRKAITHAATDH